MFRRPPKKNEPTIEEAFAAAESSPGFTESVVPAEAPPANDWESDYEGQLAVDVYETADDLVIKAPIAGVSPQQLDIQITDSQLTIRGEREDTHQLDADNIFFQECYWGTFSRTFPLPIPVRAKEAKASIRHGLLTIRLPKEENAKRHRVAVEVEE